MVDSKKKTFYQSSQNFKKLRISEAGSEGSTKSKCEVSKELFLVTGCYLTSSGENFFFVF
jgi:hypothetical protein